MKKMLIRINHMARKVAHMPRVHAHLEKRPKLRACLGRRCAPDAFKGLPLTLLATALVVTAVFLVAIIDDYLTHEALVSLDVRVVNLLYIFRSDILLRFFYFVTLSAEFSVVAFLVAAVSIFLWTNRQYVYIGGLWFALFAGEGLATLGKMLFHRQRPDMFLRAITETSFSFPSGHAATVVPLYGFIVYLIFKSHVGRKTKIGSAVFFLALVFLVDLSRLFLGVHYLSDVIAGNLVGLAVLIIAIIGMELVLEHRDERVKNIIKPSHTLVFLVTAFAAVSVVFYFSPDPVSKEKIVDTQHIYTGDVLSLFDTNMLPRVTETLTAAPQEPISLIIIAPQGCFVDDVAKAGWVLADGVSFKTTGKFAKAAAFNKEYPTAPMTPSFFNAEPHDYGFQKETEANTIRARHHARFWDTPYETPFGSLYVGTVSLDTGIKWGVLTHRIAPDIDTEREVFLSDLEGAGVVMYSELVSFVPPTLGKNFTGDPFFTHGDAQFIVLSSCDQ